MSKENKLVPKLRFPEFVNQREWEKKKFSEYIVLYRGSSPRPIQDFLTRNKDGINWIKIGDTKFAKNNIIKHVEERITQKGAEKSRKVVPGELILANSMSFGKTYLLEIGGCIYDGWFVLREFEKYFDRQFLLQILNSEYMQNQFIKLSAGGIVQNISSEIVYNSFLPYSLITEQQKIADCLSSLDDLITAENEKLDALKNHKKGLMQQFFPIEGDKVPKLRFPEFKNSGDWNECSFSDLLHSIIDFRGRTPIKLGMNWGGGNVISLSANNVKNGYIDYNAECHLGSDELFNKWMGKVKLEKGDIVFTMEAPLGNALLVPDDQNYILSQRVVAFKTKSNVNNKFLIQLIWSSQFQNEIEKLSTGSTAKGINQKRLNTLKLLFPEKIKEQQLISEMLESIDYEITSQAAKVKELKNHKKGLMQQLFPTIN